MKTAEEIFNKTYYKKNLILDTTHMMLAVIDAEQFESALAERDQEWKQKIQTALDKTSNWNCKEVLTKLLEDK